MQKFLLTRRLLTIGAGSVALCAVLAGQSYAATDTVVVYSSNANADSFIKRFNQEHPELKASLVYLPGGELLSRLKSEKAAPQADVWWAGGDPGLSDPGLFEPLSKEIIDSVLPEFRLGSGYGAPMNGYVNGFLYNTDLVTEAEAPKSWKDLADPRWKGKIYFANPVSSSGAYSILANWVEVGGWDLVKAIAKNLVMVESGFDPVKGVTDGEVPIGIANESYLAYIKTNNARMVYPSDGNFVIPVSLLKIKGGPNAKNAETVIKWLLSRETQEFMTSTEIGMRPAIQGLEAKGVPPIAKANVIATPDKVNADRANYLKSWKEILVKL